MRENTGCMKDENGLTETRKCTRVNSWSEVQVDSPRDVDVDRRTWLIAYWIMDFQGEFFLLVLVSTGLAMGASSLALALGCSVATAKSAQELAPLMFVPQILFTGIFVSINIIPPSLRWIQYLCALKYAINLGCIIEFHDSPPFSRTLSWISSRSTMTCGGSTFWCFLASLWASGLWCTLGTTIT